MLRLVFVADDNDGLLLLLLEGGRFGFDEDECLKEGEKGGKTDEGVFDWCV